MATINKDLSTIWSVLSFGTPNIEFFYPVDVPAYYVRIYHGINNNTPNRLIIKTVGMGISAGGVYNFRDVGYDDERIKLDIVLATKEEAKGFTSFFKDIVRGSANIFYYRNNFTGQESAVRFMNNTLVMGESEGHPYSFSVLMRKEAVSVTVVSSLFLIGSKWSPFSILMVPTGSRTLYGTGSNQNGQLGFDEFEDKYRYTQLSPATDWVLGGVGSNFSVFLKESGLLFVSGANDFGQLGLGDEDERRIFTQLGILTWSKISCGANFTAAIKTDGTLWVWGENEWGQLGQGTNDSNPHSSPLQIGSAVDWADVSCGQFYLIALKSDGTLWGCGMDLDGQLGQGSVQNIRSTLTKIGTDTDWASFAAGSAHTMAIKTDGTLWGWGFNSQGALGNGTGVDSYSPIQIGIDTWLSIEAAGDLGADWSHGIKTDGTLWGCGFNSNYMLGDGTIIDRLSFVLISSDEDWVDVVANMTGGLALKSNNDIWTWGTNFGGELGFDPSEVVEIPTPIQTFLPVSIVNSIWDVQSV